MDNQLIMIIKEERVALEHLLSLLKKQYEFIMNKDAFSLEEIVENIKVSNKDIAQREVERRKVVGSNRMNEVVFESNNDELKDEYRKIKNIIREVQYQKETNDMLLKQEISFNTQILNIINPSRETKTYTSMGNLAR